MSVETFIGWRYLKARRKQTFISLITYISLGGVAVGVAALIVVLAVMSGAEEDLKKKVLEINSHIIVRGYGRAMDEYKELTSLIKTLPGVISAEPFIYSQVMLNGKGGVSGAVLRGVEPAQVAETAFLRPLVKTVGVGVLDAPFPGVFLGKELADRLKVSPGDSIRAVSPLRDNPRVRHFKVAGIFESGMYDYDLSLAYISLGQAQDFLGLGQRATGIEARVADIYQAPDIRAEIVERLGPSYWAKDWMQMNKNLFSALKLQKAVMFIILSLTILVAAFNIVSTLMMVIMEKNRDMAILKSMGAARGLIMRIFIFQGLAVGVIGTVIGFLGGVALCELLSRYKFVTLPTDVYFFSRLPVQLEALDVAVITLSAIVVSFLATLYPAWLASRLNPVEALRYE
ncbi:MAG: lipoprotein-releasing ABC transporter permease subunit [Pseudomonadota bacterium]